MPEVGNAETGEAEVGNEAPAVSDDAQAEFDYSSIDPEKEWACLGTIDPEHTECKACPFRQKCAEKAGVELDEG